MKAARLIEEQETMQSGRQGCLRRSRCCGNLASRSNRLITTRPRCLHADRYEVSVSMQLTACCSVWCMLGNRFSALRASWWTMTKEECTGCSLLADAFLPRVNWEPSEVLAVFIAQSQISAECVFRLGEPGSKNYRSEVGDRNVFP